MKKAVYIIAIIALLFASALINSKPVFAAGEATFTVTTAATKTEGLGVTKEITIVYGVKDFVNFEQFENKGINVFRGNLDFDDKVFEPIQINTDSNGYFTSIKTTTKKGDLAMLGQSGWSGVAYNPDTKRFVITNGSYINQEDLVIKITLRVKATAPAGKTTISIKNVEAANPQKDIYPTNRTVSTEVEVVPGMSEATDPDYNNGFGGYIRILPDLTVGELKQIQPVFTTIKDASGKTLANADYVPTGATTADSNFSYTLIAVGDLNSDGKMSATDLSRMQMLIVNLDPGLNDNQKRAADIRWDAKLSATDLSQAKLLVVDYRDPRVATWYGTGTATCKPVDGKSN